MNMFIATQCIDYYIYAHGSVSSNSSNFSQVDLVKVNVCHSDHYVFILSAVISSKSHH